VRLDAQGRLAQGALARRLDAAARAWADGAGAHTVVVVSGGRRWGSTIEADVMASELSSRGVPERAIVRERCSLSTFDNARFSAAILGRRGVTRADVVTCGWHLPRAMALFSRNGIEVRPVAAADAAGVTWRQRLWRGARERALVWWELPAHP
jgi:uncharacterized SAM-binding protein YcdF (DUF218 family)